MAANLPRVRTVASMLGWTTVVVLSDMLVGTHASGGDAVKAVGILALLREFGRTYVPHLFAHAAAFAASKHAGEAIEARREHDLIEGRRYNHDIEGLVGRTIQFLLVEFLDRPPIEVPPQDERAIRRIAECAPTEWLRAAQALPVRHAVDQDAMLELALRGAAGSTDTDFLSEADWTSLLSSLAARCSKIDAAPGAPALASAARYCQRRYANQFFNDIKSAPQLQPKAAEALRWKATALLAGLARETALAVDSTRDEVKALREDLLRFAGAAAAHANVGWNKLSRKDRGALGLMKRNMDELSCALTKELAAFGVELEEIQATVQSTYEEFTRERRLAGERHSEMVGLTESSAARTVVRIRAWIMGLGFLLIGAGGLGAWWVRASWYSPALVRSFIVSHYRPDGRGQSQPIGELTLGAARVRFDDGVKLAVTFDRPLYCYVFSLDTNGVVKLRYPTSDAERPKPGESVVYPVAADKDYRLNDGPGTQAFVVLAARSALPPFREWGSASGPLTWKPPVNVDGVWMYDGIGLRRLGASRGEERSSINDLQPFVDAIERLKPGPSDLVLRAIAFPVYPAGDPAGTSPEG